MTSRIEAGSMAPPLGLLWRSQVRLSSAVTGPDTLYGVAADSHLVALNANDGSQRWVSTGTYLPSHIARQGSRLVAFRMNEGLTYVDDQNSSASERVAVSFGVDRTTRVSTPVFDGRMIYVAVNDGLYAIDQDRGLQFGAALGSGSPYTIAVLANGDVVVINGSGIPSRYRVGQDKFEKVWDGEAHGVSTDVAEHAYLVSGSLLIIGVSPNTVAYDLTNGRLRWNLPNVAAETMCLADDVLYAATFGAKLWAISITSGQIRWQRQFIYTPTAFRQPSLAVVDGTLYYGAMLKNHPDATILMAFNTDLGTFAWMSRAVTSSWAAGFPLVDGNRLYVFGGDHTGAYVALAGTPGVRPDQLSVTPRPLRGAAGSFGSGTIGMTSSTSAQVSIAAFRERTGMTSPILSNANWGAGHHEVSWNTTGSTGFTDDNQFGYVLFDIQEASGPAYTQALLLPVNTFPDIISHWSRFSVEIMVYNKYLSGYPDQLFRPDNQLTRAESCTIIAKTLGMEAPTPGFQTSFTDIGQHWARNYIMALEEQKVIGGFAEPDGTFTFRPELNMTRGQEARVLVRAYQVPAAPTGFETKFTDIAQHWARPDIEALEAAGFVNGFRESDGTFTYRPEQNLSRAEICALIVRIRELHR